MMQLFQQPIQQFFLSFASLIYFQKIKCTKGNSRQILKQLGDVISIVILEMGFPILA